MDPSHEVHADVAGIVASVPGDDIPSDHIAVHGDGPTASSAFDVDRMLAASAAYCVAAADAIAARREVAVPARVIDRAHQAAFCTTHVMVDGAVVPAWADLSGVYPTADGRHLQIHCNFPHHGEGVVRRLGCASDPDSVAVAIATRNAFDLEAELIDDGMIAAVVRTLDEWEAHPHAAATRGLPLVTVERIGDGEPIADGPPGTAALDGVRVLDCSRVLAGPVAGQMLAGFGADVLRLGADHLPSVPVGVISTGFGKRNAFADLRTDAGRSAMRELLASADVWIDAYRPGAFAGHGFDLAAVADLRPGIVVVQISAFDWSGPWAGRRGFDSIVQSTTGVRWAGGEFAVDASGAPIDRGPLGLPVQALDYATGFVAAGVAAQLLAHQREAGGSWLGRVSLLRARDWLCGMRDPAPYVPRPVAVDDRFVHTVDSDFGRVTTVRPFIGQEMSAPRRLGTAPPSWLERPR
jgi:crotonobetainyl-CoA:carnitine CoA-transferase CaiB-like acyl-CoA transferase